MRAYQNLDSGSPWHGSGGHGHGLGPHGGSSRLFDFPTVTAGGSGGDWGMGLISTQPSLYGSLAQQ